MGELQKLPNLGPVIEQQLANIGVYTKDDLVNIGSLEAWLAIQRFDPSACYNRLLSLEAAIQGIPKRELSQTDRDWLKQFYREHKQRDSY